MLMFWFQYRHLRNLQSCSGDKPQPTPPPIFLNLSSYLHVFRRAHGYDWMHFARSGQFQDLSWSSFMTTSPWMGCNFKTFCNHSPMMGCYFKTFSVLWAKSVCPNPCLPHPTQHTHMHTQSQRPHHINSPCFICYS